MGRHLATSIAAVVALVMWTGPTASAANLGVSCGATISQSVTLTHNLVCPGVAFTIDAFGPPRSTPTIVDLAGHTVSSVGGGTSVQINGGFSRLQNGRITGWASDLASRTTYTGLEFDGGGLTATSNASPVIRGNRFVRGARVATNNSGADVEGNLFSGAPGVGTAMGLSLTWATVIANAVTGYAVGILVTGPPSSADIRSNLISGSGTGIIVGGDLSAVPGLVDSNLVINNSGDGILLGDGSGIGTTPAFPKPGLKVSNNVVAGNGGDGIRIDPGAQFLGILVTVTDNQAVRNAFHGIESPGSIPPKVMVTDGGDNLAAWNGLTQCVHVTCAAH